MVTHSVVIRKKLKKKVLRSVPSPLSLFLSSADHNKHSREHSFPPLRHKTKLNPFKMVKMVESAEEFNMLKKGDKPVRSSLFADA